LITNNGNLAKAKLMV